MYKTERLTLRRFTAADLTSYYSFVSNPEVMKYLPCVPYDFDSACESLVKIIGRDDVLAIVLNDSGRVIGSLSLEDRGRYVQELQIMLAREFWGLGYAREACEAVIRQSFEAGAHRIYACCPAQNTRAVRLLEAVGLTREGLMRSSISFRDDENGKPVWCDSCVYGILENE